jgi:hypothetical protein
LINLKGDGGVALVALTTRDRVVVAAIESGNSKFFREACINGYEYLDKIVQMPFAIPLMTDSEKKKLIEGYLNPNPNIKVGYCYL